jgi:hypothetical protein
MIKGLTEARTHDKTEAGTFQQHFQRLVIVSELVLISLTKDLIHQFHRGLITAPIRILVPLIQRTDGGQGVPTRGTVRPEVKLPIRHDQTDDRPRPHDAMAFLQEAESILRIAQVFEKMLAVKTAYAPIWKRHGDATIQQTVDSWLLKPIHIHPPLFSRGTGSEVDQ